MTRSMRRFSIALVMGIVAVTVPLTLGGAARAADGTWERAWGKDVIQSGVAGDTGTGFEICTVASNCKNGTGGGLGGEFGQPLGVAVDAAGNVYIADDQNQRIQKFESDGDFLRVWGNDVVQEDLPGDIDPDGFEICTVAANCKAGLFGGGFGGALSGPQDVAVDGSGNVYVVGADQRVQKFDSDGNWERAWGRDVVQEDRPGDADPDGFEICTVAVDCKGGDLNGDLGGEFRGPHGVAVDGAGNVYVGDEIRQRVQKFDSSGNFLRAWGNDVVQEDQPGDVDPDGFEVCTDAADCKTGVAAAFGGAFSNPRRIAVDGSGNVYVGDITNQRIQKFDSDGTWERAWGKDVVTGGSMGFEVCTAAADCKQGTTGGLGGEFTNPIGVATDGVDLYVADRDNLRIQKFDASGSFLRAWGNDVVQEDQPGDVDPEGFEICTSAAVCKSGQPGSGGGGEVNQVDGVGADASGNLYITHPGGQRVQKFTDPAPPPTVTVSIGDVTVTEGTGGKTRANFFATLSGASATSVTVDFGTQDGTATAPADYGSLSGTKTFAPGVVTKRIQVPVVSDALNEPDETFSVVLSNPTGATIADGTGVGMIEDDDVAGDPTISVGDASVVEGADGTLVGARFRVTLSTPSANSVTVQWSTADNTATAPADFMAPPPTVLTFDPGQTSKTITVKVRGDDLVELDETFFVNLASPTNATIADGQGIGTITNDD